MPRKTAFLTCATLCTFRIANVGAAFVTVASNGCGRAAVTANRRPVAFVIVIAVPDAIARAVSVAVSGTVAAIGEKVSQWKLGDAVCALTPGGGYAEYCAAPAAHF